MDHHNEAAGWTQAEDGLSNPFTGRLEELRQAGAGGEQPEPSKQPRRQHRHRQPSGSRYIQLPEAVAVAGFKALRCPGALVFYAILYRMWRRHEYTIVLTNKWLEKLGIDRQTKRRALPQLERAGLIRVTYRNNKNPVVTLLQPYRDLYQVDTRPASV